MAQYKVIQDIEAEDKLLGPLTLKGFIYAIIAGSLAFINFRLVTASTLGKSRWLLFFLFLFPMLLFGVLASPLGREQPTEVWLLSRVRFLFKPRKRIWDQSGVKNLVTITAPKKIEPVRTKSFTQPEVKSRLKTLAMTLDSRGWAVKNVNLNLGGQPTNQAAGDDTDRLVPLDSLPQTAPVIDVHAADDMLDEQNNPTAQHVQGLMQQAEAQRKEQVVNTISQARATGLSAAQGPPLTLAAPTPNPPPLRPPAAAPAKPPQPASAPSTVTPTPQTAKLELSQSGNDLSVASIAQLANRPPKLPSNGDEVVIRLH